MIDIAPFVYNGQRLRAVTIEGEPWFVLADLCRSLDLSNTTMVAERLDADALSTAEVIDSMGRTQSVRIVSEPGMYEVVIRSDKPEAAAFRRWITAGVLPAIRKHGGYLTPEATAAALTDPDFIIGLATKLKAEHLYLVEFVDHGVKVGVSAQPFQRIKQHHRDASAFGRKVGRTWVSPIAHSEARANEKAIRGDSRREYVTRTFDDCLEQALDLPMTEVAEQQGMSPMNQFLSAWFPGYADFLAREEGMR